MSFYTRSFHQMSTSLWIHVLTLRSLELLCVLVLRFPLYLQWILSGGFLEKKFFLTLCQLSFTIIRLGSFWPAFFFPILRVPSRTAGEILMFIFMDIVSITIPWPKRQFWREYCSYLFISFPRSSTCSFITDIFPSKFLIICSLSFLSFPYSSNFVHIKLTVSLKSFSCSSPLI